MIENFFRHDRAVNLPLLAEGAAFEVWICNNDTNLGGIVAAQASPAKDGLVRLLAIDFEASTVLRGHNRIEVEAVDTRKYWPESEALRSACRALGHQDGFCTRIAQLSEDAIAGAFSQLSGAVDGLPIPWSGAATQYLHNRARRIHDLVREASSA